MTRDPPDVVEFSPPEVGPVLDRLRGARFAHSGWVNLRPEVDPDDETSEPGAIAGVFATRGPSVPVLTWIPGRETRRGVEPDSIGVLHGRGQQLAQRLDELAITVPAGWRVVQDHPRRGLVLRIPEGADLDTVLRWMIGTGEALATVALTGQWRAECFSGR